MPRRRWIPWLVLAALAMLTFGAAAIAITETSETSVTPSQLETELKSPIGLGLHWSLEGSPRAVATDDTWTPSTCYSYSTTFGGPAAEATYETDVTGFPFFQEAILIPSEDPNAILDMLASCGKPKAPLPPALRHGNITYLHEARLSVFDGLGDGSFAVVAHPRIGGSEQTEINAYFSLGDELVRITYGGKAPLSSVRLAATSALAGAARYR